MSDYVTGGNRPTCRFTYYPGPRRARLDHVENWRTQSVGFCGARLFGDERRKPQRWAAIGKDIALCNNARYISLVGGLPPQPPTP
jgi:hypothetical protein